MINDKDRILHGTTRSVVCHNITRVGARCSLLTVVLETSNTIRLLPHYTSIFKYYQENLTILMNTVGSVNFLKKYYNINGDQEAYLRIVATQ